MRTSNNGYLIQLDGLRFVAVALVLVDHWLAEINTVPYGKLGVTLFFVLSGFLITRILMVSREKTIDKEGGMGQYMKKFYIRRTLRIFPVYYLTIAVLYVINEPPVRETLSWCLLYATNIYIAVNQHWMGTIDHFWSLAVEEQFYLFFPIVIFLIPRRWLVEFLVSIIVLSVVLRLYFFLAGYEWMVNYVSMPMCLDSFGLGGLMAWMQLRRQELFIKVFQNPIWIWLGLLAWIAVVIWAKSFEEVHNVANDVVDRLVSSVFCFFLIGKAVLGFDGITKWFLEHPVSSYLGKISYGIYVYHNFVYNYFHTPPTHPTLRMLHKIQTWMPVVGDSLVFQMAFYFLLTTCLAALSWQFIEKPINSLKDKYAR